MRLIRNRVWALVSSVFIQSSGAQGPQNQPPAFDSVSVAESGEITFRVFAPKANSIKLSSSDIPNLMQGLELKKSEQGVWEGTSAKVPPGAYRYNFNVDGLSVIDPRNSKTSESNMNTWSLAVVPGSADFDLKDVPHGAVAVVPYYSKSLKKFRRMHVYTPPGYERSSEEFPVLYLLHGAFDCDNSWSTVGMAGSILDNLIASGKAKPMIVVMPMGHTGSFAFGPGNSFEKQMEEFVTDFQQDIKPLVEDRYRIKKGRQHTAIAGLSMGGAHTLQIALDNLDHYAYIGVFSSGVFGIDRGTGPDSPRAKWEARYSKGLKDAELKKGLNLVWFGTGKEDFLLGTSRETVAALKSYEFDVQFDETEGGHTWLVWRDYLCDFAQRIFTK